MQSTMIDPRRERALPAHPTDAFPGTPEKVAVLAARAALRLNLFHPLDRKDGHSARDGYDVPERPTVPLGRRLSLPVCPPEGVRLTGGARKPYEAFVRVGERLVVLGRFRTKDAAAETARRARQLLAQRKEGSS